MHISIYTTIVMKNALAKNYDMFQHEIWPKLKMKNALAKNYDMFHLKEQFWNTLKMTCFNMKSDQKPTRPGLF